jgi:hypothetical protein
VVPDGREDISLAAAFEIGRLLALSRPSMIAALMRWRQDGYQVARRAALWKEIVPFVEAVLGRDEPLVFDPRVGVLLGRGLVDAVIKRPQDFVGDPSPLVTVGQSLPIDGAPQVIIAQGFGLDANTLIGDPVSVLGKLREATVLEPPERGAVHDADVRAILARTLEQQVSRLVADALATSAEGTPGPERIGEPDALDRLLEREARDES